MCFILADGEVDDIAVGERLMSALVELIVDVPVL